MLTVCVGGVGVGGGYCRPAMSVFIPCFLKLFEVTGAFLWEIKSIRRGQRGRAEPPQAPSELRAGRTTAAGVGRVTHTASSPFSIYQHLQHFTAGITAKH